MNNIINHTDLLAAKQLIDNSNHIVITIHISPDGDAIGSSHALKFFLRSLGKTDVQIIAPNEFPSFLAWLPESCDVINFEKQPEYATELMMNADLLIAADYNEPKRVANKDRLNPDKPNGMAIPLIESKAKKLMIDHHVGPSDFADISISHPEIPSCCELVYHLILELGMQERIDTTIATCIFTGMMTDTVNFSVNMGNPDTYVIIEDLLSRGIKRDTIYNNVYNQYSADRMRLLGYCLYRKMKIYPKYRTSVIALSGKELYPFNFQSGDAEGMVNFPLQIADVDMSVFMRQDKEKIKISFRSKGDLATNIFARKYFNGGGHKNAAGGESYMTIEETVKYLEKCLPDLKNCQ